MKWRNSKERELLSQGGTREQTRPSKDNQNPGLSDPLEQSRETEIGEAAGKDKRGLVDRDKPMVTLDFFNGLGMTQGHQLD